jgi:GDP-4-dehydro-6-deoxy-D-mannose reductase
VGRHLSDYLLARGDSVFGLDQVSPILRKSSESVTHLRENICEKADVERTLRLSQPDIVYHLAGITKSKEAKDLLGIKPTVFVASSSAVYGIVSARKKITESCRVRPVTHYGTSKAAEEIVAEHGFLACGLTTVCARTFNLIGPGQPSSFACFDFAYQIALAETSQRRRAVLTGNLNAKRDFVDVRDAVRAYALIADHGKPRVIYNVCSGTSIGIGECLRLLLGQ